MCYSYCQYFMVKFSINNFKTTCGAISIRKIFLNHADLFHNSSLISLPFFQKITILDGSPALFHPIPTWKKGLASIHHQFLGSGVYTSMMRSSQAQWPETMVLFFAVTQLNLDFYSQYLFLLKWGASPTIQEKFEVEHLFLFIKRDQVNRIGHLQGVYPARTYRPIQTKTRQCQNVSSAHPKYYEVQAKDSGKSGHPQ